jgi:hypothetical protein
VSKKRKSPKGPTIIYIGAGLVLSTLLSVSHINGRIDECIEATEYSTAVDLCGEWGMRNICVIGVEDLVELRRHVMTARTPFCRKYGVSYE